MEKVTVLFQSSPNYSGNSKVMYDYIKSKYKNKMNLCWVIDNKKDYENLKEKLNCVMYGSKEMMQLISKANIIFTTHGQLKEYKHDNQIYVNLWHGITMKKLGYMISENNMAKQDQLYCEQLQICTDYVIVPSKFWQLIFCAIFNVNFSHVLPLGCPKLDPIIKADGKGNLKKLLGEEIKNYKKIIYYMPTFRSGCGRNDSNPNLNNILNLEEYNERLFLDYLENNNYLLCIKYHPEEKLNFKYDISNNIKIIDEEKLQLNNFSVYDVLNAADLLITDYSSLGLEFSISDKPVIYLDTDLEDYQKNRGLIFDDKDFWFQGNDVSNIKQLLDKMEIYLKKGKYKNKMKEIWFGNLKDGGLEQICNYFFTTNGSINNQIKSGDNLTFIQHKKIDDLNEKNKKLNLDNDFLKRKNKQQENELNLIYNSKSWKLMEKIRKIKNKFFKFVRK